MELKLHPEAITIIIINTVIFNTKNGFGDTPTRTG